MIVIEPKTFVRFATYNGLFGSVSLVNHPELLVVLSLSEHNGKDYFIDGVDLWSVEGWIDEQKRRRSMSESVVATVKIETTKTKEQLIVEATLRGDLAEALRLVMMKG